MEMNPNPTEVDPMSSSPFPFLSASDLRSLFSILTGEGMVCAPESVTLAHDGHEVIVKARDLWFIHQMDASRFGDHETCPVCVAEMAEA